METKAPLSFVLNGHTAFLFCFFLPLFPARLSNTLGITLLFCHVCMHVGRKLRKRDLFPRSRLQANAYSSYSLWSSIHLGPVHAYPDIFESANFSLRIQKFPRPHVPVFKSNLPFHTYPDSLSVRQPICKAIFGSCETFIANLLH